MKSTIKKNIPSFIKNRIIKFRQNFELFSLYLEDESRFKKFSAVGKSSYDYKIVRSQVMYYTHQIEKGLSRKNFRYGFGSFALTNLIKYLIQMENFPDGEVDDFFQNGVSALKAYQDKHISIDGNVPNINLFPEKLLSRINQSNSDMGGTNYVLSKDKEDNSNLNFKELAMRRSSIRDFKVESEVDLSEIKEAIEISIKSPSVCNRQSSRVKIINNKEILRQVLELQGGFAGYELPDKLLLVTSDLSNFLRAHERNQCFTDGGLFSMSLLYALEYKGIAACPLSANVSKEKSKKIRNLISLPENENLIMFIACGKMEDKVKIPKSYRSPYDKIATMI